MATSFGNPNFCIRAALIGCLVQLIRELCELEEHGVKCVEVSVEAHGCSSLSTWMCPELLALDDGE